MEYSSIPEPAASTFTAWIQQLPLAEKRMIEIPLLAYLPVMLRKHSCSTFKYHVCNLLVWMVESDYYIMAHVLGSSAHLLPGPGSAGWYLMKAYLLVCNCSMF
jgi:hypothetical protein